MFSTFKYKKGFSLIELLVVIAIIGILAAVILANLSEAKAQGRDVARISDMREFAKSLESYYQDHGEYPPCENGGEWCGSCDQEDHDVFASALEPLVDDGIIPKIPADPLSSKAQTGDCFTYAYITPPTYVEDMCGDKPVSELGYALTFSLESKTLSWAEFSPNLVASGTTYCIFGQDSV